MFVNERLQAVTEDADLVLAFIKHKEKVQIRYSFTLFNQFVQRIG